nr:DNA methyltransferase [Nannocystis sp.]
MVDAFQNFHVLDPACGCGNFLLAVRDALAQLAAAITERCQALALPPPPGPYFTLGQLHGIELDAHAAAIARNLLADPQHPDTAPDIRTGDALLLDWPRPAGELAIVGNPPYLGVRKLRRALGDELVRTLFARYPDNRAADYATYWFTRAREHLRPGERAGYVCTNSIAQNTNRIASLDRILAAGGTITDAWRSYPWPGDAVVHVSIINWISGPHAGPCRLAGRPVAVISAQLCPVDSSHAERLPENAGLGFMGVTPGSAGFVLAPAAHAKLLARDPASAAVLVPFLVGRDISRDPQQQPSRTIIDFATMTLTDARRHPGALAHVRRHVLPHRRENPREAAMPHWWQFWRPAPALRQALARARHVLVIPCLAPHLLVVRQPRDRCFDHQLIVITLADAYHLGILQSRLHALWARARGSTLKGDLRYTISTILETFPFPIHPDGHYDPRRRPRTALAARVAACATHFDRLRRAACREHDIGLTRLHNYLERPALTQPHESLELPSANPRPATLDLGPLRRSWTALNDAVAACYGFPPYLWRDDDAALAALLALNTRHASQAPPRSR